MTDSEIFFLNINNYCKENGIEIAQLCTLAGNSVSYISQLQKTFNPQYSCLKRFADYMKMSVPELFCLKSEYAKKQWGIDTRDYNCGSLNQLQKENEDLMVEWEKVSSENESLKQMHAMDSEDIQTLKREIKSLKEKKVNLEDLDIVVFMCRNKDEMYVEIDGEKIDLKCKGVDGERGYITLELPYKSTTFYMAKEPDTDE